MGKILDVLEGGDGSEDEVERYYNTLGGVVMCCHDEGFLRFLEKGKI